MASVLLVMDDLFYRKLLRVELEEAGHGVFEALSIERALDRICRDQPELILLDPWIERGGGLRLLEDLRARNEDRPVLLVGHEWREDILGRARLLGAQGPVSPAEPDGVRDWIAAVRPSPW